MVLGENMSHASLALWTKPRIVVGFFCVPVAFSADRALADEGHLSDRSSF